ncbi:hypothetical protein IH992_32160 [Candidatus Poribacteria bacterium]|nr:hypothetical protein [Candidatus Poribacteria bacterium]
MPLTTKHQSIGVKTCSPNPSVKYTIAELEIALNQTSTFFLKSGMGFEV